MKNDLRRYRMAAAVSLLCALATAGFAGEPPGEYRAAALAAGDYLVRVQGENGRFRYFYDPRDPEKSEVYNWLRHAGTTYALAQLHALTGESRFRVAAERGASHLETALTPITIDGRDFRVVMTDFMPDSGTDRGKLVKTGGVGLGVLAFWAADRGREEPRYRELIRELGEYLLFVQRPAGGFESYYLVQRKKFDTSTSDYYPGQALLALALIESETPDPAIRAAMVRALAERVRGWSAGTIPGFDHWGLIGASRALPLIDDDELGENLGMSRTGVLSTVVDYAGAELARQAGDGSFLAKPGSAPAAATRLEGIHAVGRLLRRPGPGDEPAAAELIEVVAGWSEAIDRTRRFLLQCPYTAKQAERLADGPIDVTGGFRDICRPGRVDPLRIDNSQHGISALIGADSSF